MPWFWIVAGPNGSGKTTLVQSGAIDQTLGSDLIHLNADDLTRDILAAEPDAADANLRAAIQIDRQVARFVEHGVSFLVETVLSSDKYLDDIDRARTLGYRVGLIYVCLPTPEASIERVALRRVRGGHDVPAERIRARWYRSIANLGRIAPLAHRLYVFDNAADTGPVLIAEGSLGRIALLTPGRIPEIDAVLTAEPVRGAPETGTAERV